MHLPGLSPTLALTFLFILPGKMPGTMIMVMMILSDDHEDEDDDDDISNESMMIFHKKNYDKVGTDLAVGAVQSL